MTVFYLAWELNKGPAKILMDFFGEWRNGTWQSDSKIYIDKSMKIEEGTTEGKFALSKNRTYKAVIVFITWMKL